MDPTYQAEHPAAFWRDAATLKPTMLRYNVLWSRIAPRPPRTARNPGDRAYDWHALDGLVTDARAHKVDVLLTLWQIPSWAARYRDYRGINSVPSTVHWRNFVAAVARRYSGSYDPDGRGPRPVLPRVSKWEIWNEPNYYLYPQRDRHGHITLARDYATMVNAARAELKRRSRTNVVVAGSIAPVKTARPAFGAFNWVRMLRAARARFDVLSIHPYNQVPGLGVADGRGSAGPNVRVGNFDRFVRTVNVLWGRGRRIWITEYGLQTVPDVTGVSLAAQARFVAQAVRVLRRPALRVDRLVWFLVRDEPMYRPACRASRGCGTWQSGLRTAAGARKPSFRAWQALARR